MLDWDQQDWDKPYEALEAVVTAVRRCEQTMLDRLISEDDKVALITRQLHIMRRHMDRCAAEIERTEKEARDYELVAA